MSVQKICRASGQFTSKAVQILTAQEIRIGRTPALQDLYRKNAFQSLHSTDCYLSLNQLSLERIMEIETVQTLIVFPFPNTHHKVTN